MLRLNDAEEHRLSDKYLHWSQMLPKEKGVLSDEDFTVLLSTPSRDVSAYEFCANKKHHLQKGSFSF